MAPVPTIAIFTFVPQEVANERPSRATRDDHVTRGEAGKRPSRSERTGAPIGPARSLAGVRLVLKGDDTWIGPRRSPGAETGPGWCPEGIKIPARPEHSL